MKIAAIHKDGTLLEDTTTAFNAVTFNIKYTTAACSTPSAITVTVGAPASSITYRLGTGDASLALTELETSPVQCRAGMTYEVTGFTSVIAHFTYENLSTDMSAPSLSFTDTTSPTKDTTHTGYL